MRFLGCWLALGAMGALHGQDLRIGILDFYGLHKVSESQVRKVLGVREGDRLPPSKGDAEDRLDHAKGVVASHLEAVCCENGRTILYVGIEEPGAPRFDLHDPPITEIKLADNIISLYEQYQENARNAARRGSTAEDLTHGHSLLADPATRAVQEMFPEVADNQLLDLKTVLRSSNDEAQRAIAAYVIGYVTKKKDVVNDLQYALKDADEGVRDNAARSLMAFAVLARLNPKSEIQVAPTWFIEMLNSLSWSDRNRAVRALEILTENRDPSVMEQIRQRALDSLAEMSRWKVLDHALPAFIVLGRVAGVPEQQIQDAWSKGDRNTIITAATQKKK